MKVYRREKVTIFGTENMQENISFASLAPHLKNLRLAGYYQLDSKTSKRKRLLHDLYMRLILTLISLFTVQQIIKVYQVRDDVNKVMETLFLLLTNSDAIYKQVILWRKANHIEELFNAMKGPVFNQDQPKHKELLLNTAKEAKLVLRVFNNIALFTCLLWVLYPVMLHLQMKPAEFSIWLPFDSDLNPQFYFVALYVWVQTSWLAFGNTSMDALISFFFAQCKTQLSILRLDLKCVADESKEEAAKTAISFKSIFQRRFRKILRHYDEIIKFSSKTQEIFGGAVLYQFLIGGWIICTAAYRTVNIDPTSVQFVSMIIYMCCILTELALYCFYGNEVTHESVKLTESIYSMDWLEVPLEERRNILILMERVKRPIEPVAGVLIPLSNSTFVSIIRSSYTFYTFLKNTE